MGAAEEILESFFMALSRGKVFDKPFIDKLEALARTGTLDRATLRRLVEEANPGARKD